MRGPSFGVRIATSANRQQNTHPVRRRICSRSCVGGVFGSEGAREGRRKKKGKESGACTARSRKLQSVATRVDLAILSRRRSISPSSFRPRNSPLRQRYGNNNRKVDCDSITDRHTRCKPQLAVAPDRNLSSI